MVVSSWYDTIADSEKSRDSKEIDVGVDRCEKSRYPWQWLLFFREKIDSDYLPMNGHIVGWLVDEVNKHSVSLAGMDGRAGKLPVHRRDDPWRLAKLAYRKVSDLTQVVAQRKKNRIS